MIAHGQRPFVRVQARYRGRFGAWLASPWPSTILARRTAHGWAGGEGTWCAKASAAVGEGNGELSGSEPADCAALAHLQLT